MHQSSGTAEAVPGAIAAVSSGILETSSLTTMASSEQPPASVAMSHASGSAAVIDIPLPNYSQRVLSVLMTKNIVPELDRMVEETAYHILSHGDIHSRDGYEAYGRRLYQQYPCIEFPGTEPWVWSIPCVK